jgi:hypothetical protein
LHLAADHEPTAEEVDVVDLHRGCLAETETGEGAERDEGREPFLGGRQKTTDLGRPYPSASTLRGKDFSAHKIGDDRISGIYGFRGLPILAWVRAEDIRQRASV